MRLVPSRRTRPTQHTNIQQQERQQQKQNEKYEAALFACCMIICDPHSPHHFYHIGGITPLAAAGPKVLGRKNF